MQITEIVKCGQNVKIYIDNEYWADIPYLIAFDFRLQKGMEVDDSFLYDIDTKAKEKTAFDYCIWYLSRYNATTKKMKSKLYEKEYKKNIVDSVIEKLIQLKYLDDYAFAENLVNAKSKTLGKNRLKNELKRKGIAEDIINSVVNSIDSEDTFEAALRVANKWYRSHEFESMEDMQKFLRFMAYRGFDYDTISKCREELRFGKDNR